VFEVTHKMSLFRKVISPRCIYSFKEYKNPKKLIHSTSFHPQLPQLKTLLSASETDVVGESLRRILGNENVQLSESVKIQHGQDEGPDKGIPPDIVAFAESTEHVAEICKYCYKSSIPIIPYGTGTGLESGISAVYGGVCIDMSKMDSISDYHMEDFDVKVQPGVTREGLNHFIKNDGLTFPVDPGANASICGMCATGASGTNAVRYGTIKENCLNLEVVLPDGRILDTAGKNKRPKKSSAGYNLTNLFIGSEGTLGVITNATMKLHPLPESVSAAIVHFPTIESAVDTVVQTLQNSLPIARIELLDEVSVQASNNYSKLGLVEKPTLFFEFHGSESGLEQQTELVKEIADINGGSDFKWAAQQEDRNRLWTARHKLYYAILNIQPGSRAVITDVCVPPSRLPDILVETRKDIDTTGIIGPCFGHVGDGNFHAVLLFDPEKPEEYKRCKEISYRMGYRAMEMGGTCTGEHGIGIGKRNLLQDMFGEVGIDIMRNVKHSIDPKGIMNPGKVLFPLETSQ